MPDCLPDCSEEAGHDDDCPMRDTVGNNTTDAMIRWREGGWHTLAETASDIVFGGESAYQDVAPSCLAYKLREVHARRSHRNLSLPRFAFRRIKWRFRQLRRWLRGFRRPQHEDPTP